MTRIGPRILLPVLAVALTSTAARSLARASEPDAVPMNTWTRVDIDFERTLKDFLGDRKGRWSQTDGYSDSVFHSTHGTVLIRTGIHCDDLGLSPGFYTNATVEWNLVADTARVVEVANWSGGSYGGGKLLPAYQEHRTPTPRHTYDGICFVPPENRVYMMLGANWRIGARGSTEEARTELKKDAGRSWAYSFDTRRWECIEDNVWNYFKCSPYENHMTWWPGSGKLLFLNDNGNRYAQFDLKTRKWQPAELANECPMRLYNARSTWDSKRSLWVFRLGPKLCTLNPATSSFEMLPSCYEMQIPTRDEVKQLKAEGKKPDARLAAKGICYVSKYDRYLVCGPTGNDTAAYDPTSGTWTAIKAGPIELVNGYMQYNPELDVVAMNFQLSCFKFRYKPAP